MPKYYYRGETFTSQRELQMYRQIYLAHLPLPETQFKPFDTDKRAFDFVWLDKTLLVEVQGGTWTKGAHTRGKGYRRDVEKHNDAVLDGWTVLWFTSDMLDDESALDTLRKVLT